MHGQVGYSVGENLQVCSSEFAGHGEVLEECPLLVLHVLGTRRGMVAHLRGGGRKGGEGEGDREV